MFVEKSIQVEIKTDKRVAVNDVGTLLHFTDNVG